MANLTAKTSSNIFYKKLMEYFGCVDITEMPLKVFPTNKEYGHVSKQVLKVLGLTEEDDETKETEDAKN